MCAHDLDPCAVCDGADLSITEHFWYGNDRLVFSHSVAEARATLPRGVLVALEATGHAQHGWSDFHLHRADESPLPRWQERK